MTGLLYRLASWSVRRHWAVIVGWVVIIAVLAALAAAFHGPTSDAFTIPAPNLSVPLMCWPRSSRHRRCHGTRRGRRTPGHKVTEPQYVKIGRSRSGRSRRHRRSNSCATDRGKRQQGSADRVRHRAICRRRRQDHAAGKGRAGSRCGSAAKAGLEIEYSGGSSRPRRRRVQRPLRHIIAFFVLTITFGSLVSAGLRCLTGILGVAVGLLSINALSGVIALSSTAPTLSLMLGLAVGIDYTLFILSRHRQQLREGVGYDESIRLATATAGGAVVFAGLTVVIALSALSVVGIPFLTVMGLAAAGTVVCVVLLH